MSTLTTNPAPQTASPKESPDHIIRTLPVLVLFPHNRCNCRCVMCDIWRIRQAREITARDLEPHLESIRALGVRWVVFSGGEPQMHSDLASLCDLFRGEGIRLTLLTAGLMLESFAGSIVGMLDDVIVSLDGPPEVHDLVRRIPGAFERLKRGVAALRGLRPEMVIGGRCTVQRMNHARLRETVQAAKHIGLNSISFLAADLMSEAFNRPGGWSPDRQNTVSLNAAEAYQLEHEIDALAAEYSADIRTAFIAENPAKLRRIVRHFRAHLGEASAESPPCNAPWVSAVIEADGAVRPCFFHRPLGNIHQNAFLEILNSQEAENFRKTLDIANDPVCRNCVCSLHLPQERSTAKLRT